MQEMCCGSQELGQTRPLVHWYLQMPWSYHQAKGICELVAGMFSEPYVAPLGHAILCA